VLVKTPRLDAAPIRRIEASATRTGVTVSTQQRPYGERAGPHFLSWKDFGVYQVRGRGGGVAFAVDKHKKQDKFNTLLGATDPQSALPLLTQPGGGEAGVRVKGGRGGGGAFAVNKHKKQNKVIKTCSVLRTRSRRSPSASFAPRPARISSASSRLETGEPGGVEAGMRVMGVRGQPGGGEAGVRVKGGRGIRGQQAEQSYKNLLGATDPQSALPLRILCAAPRPHLIRQPADGDGRARRGRGGHARDGRAGGRRRIRGGQAQEAE
jgi:hypothetical protein